MTKISPRATLDVRAQIDFTESELRALDALTGYGIDPFLDVFYENLGKAYMQPHEDGLRSFFESIRTLVPPILGRADAARAAFDGGRKS